MALVNYDNSSGSDNEDALESKNDVQIPPIAPKAHIPRSDASETTFLSLPKPKVKGTLILPEEYDEFLKIQEKSLEKPAKRKLIKFNIPSPSKFDSDEDEATEKKPKRSLSGLFALLPPPKGTPLSNTSFVPNVLKKKNNQPIKRPSKPATNETKPKPTKPVEKGASDSDDDDPVDIPELFDYKTWLTVCGGQNKPKRTKAPEVSLADSQTHPIEPAPVAKQPYQGLDNEAFKQLVGSNKKNSANIEIIDIHEDEMRPDREQWLKSLTDPNFEPETTVENPVNSTCKVKNHITALAQKALANDKELQIRWSENRFNRKQTQAKYGF